MSRTIQRASVLAATVAALGLVIAAPASADGVGTQAVIGTAYPQTNFMGTPTGSFDDTSVGCTDIPNLDEVTRARSATNIAPSTGETIQLYADSQCLVLVSTITPGQSDDGLDANGDPNQLGLVGAVAYISL
ncbi:hypothetical protein ACIG0D_05765 [Streptomyces sp. NPDC052773]|uniref:hypothetical protein n=1 Tax=Streptomyces sp. NPDC052773 TaxID=3365693 RepID=UPI0037D762E9